jgi:hypothetical protein
MGELGAAGHVPGGPHVLGALVRRWSSTAMNPRSVVSTPADSSPRFAGDRRTAGGHEQFLAPHRQSVLERYGDLAVVGLAVHGRGVYSEAQVDALFGQDVGDLGGDVRVFARQ